MQKLNRRHKRSVAETETRADLKYRFNKIGVTYTVPKALPIKVQIQNICIPLLLWRRRYP